VPNEGQQRQWNNPSWIDNWKSIEPSIAGLSVPLLDALAPAPGERVLDIGCGGGLTTLAIAQAVGAEGSATGVDISEPLVALASGRATEAGIPNTNFVKGDAQVADIPGGPFDAATSRLGVMFFEDPPAAFANIRRHLRPGGRLVFICFQSQENNPWFPSTVLAKYAPARPQTGFAPPTPFALGDRESTTKILDMAGFSDIELRDFTGAYDEPVDTRAGLGMLMGLQLPPDVMEQATIDMADHYRSISTNGRDQLPRHYWIVSARNPG
jgi:ubiquinone/menaquinone biosynthesis C-methylase UbiE